MSAATKAENASPSVGSYWLRTSTSGVTTEGGRFVARIEGFTPLGRPILRRIDCQHEWVADLHYLLDNYAETEPMTAVVFDYDARRAGGRYPWRTKCPTCGWGDTFGSLDEGEERADAHDSAHKTRPTP